MKRVSLLATVVAGALVASGAFGAELKSGPQTGENIPGPFHPLNITGASAGKKNCLV
jgi:hypothetical protein